MLVLLVRQYWFALLTLHDLSKIAITTSTNNINNNNNDADDDEYNSNNGSLRGPLAAHSNYVGRVIRSKASDVVGLYRWVW